MSSVLMSSGAPAATVANNTFRDQDANHKSAVSQLSDPVDFDLPIMPHNRVRYIELLRKVPTLLRRWLFLQVTRVPFGAPSRNLTEIGVSLSPLCRAVLGCQRLVDHNVDVFQHPSFRLLGVSLSEPGGSECVETGSKLGKAMDQIYRRSLPSFVLDITSTATASASAASEHGTRFVGGPFATGFSTYAITDPAPGV